MFKLLTSSILLLFTLDIKVNGADCKKDQCPDPDGICQNPANCLINPCTQNNGGCSAKEICTANYCGGCHAVCSCDKGLCYDPDGICKKKAICKKDPCENNNGGCSAKNKEICTANYCGGCHAVCSCGKGLCYDPDGKCRKKVNCFVDPCTINNGGCFQSQTCTANYCGGCHAECSCPQGEVPCLIDPCDTVKCAAGTTCVADYCGGCNANCVDNEAGAVLAAIPADSFEIKLDSAWIIPMIGILALVLFCNIIFMSYYNCCKDKRNKIGDKGTGYNVVKVVADSEDFYDSEANPINA